MTTGAQYLRSSADQSLSKALICVLTQVRAPGKNRELLHDFLLRASRSDVSPILNGETARRGRGHLVDLEWNEQIYLVIRDQCQHFREDQNLDRLK